MSGPEEKPDPPPQPEAAKSLIEYPSTFPIKVTGLNADGFAQAIADLALQHDPSFDAGTIEMRLSSGGKYVGLTLIVLATSREQLDQLYQALTKHPQVKWVL